MNADVLIQKKYLRLSAFIGGFEIGPEDGTEF